MEKGGSSTYHPIFSSHLANTLSSPMAVTLMRKQVTSTDKTSCLAYPTGNLWAFEMVERQTAVWFNAEDPTGKVWKFKLCTRNDGHKKPVIRGDWLEFVREKGLTVQDVIVLTMEGSAENGVCYKIKVEPDLELTM